MSFIVKEPLIEEFKALKNNMDSPGLLWADIFKIISKIPGILHLRGKCKWEKQGEEFANVWTSECGLTWQMGDDDSPRENRMYYCPQCGRYLEEVQEIIDD